MKIKHVVLIIVFLISTLLVGCAKKTQSIEFDENSIIMSVGESRPLNVIISPSDATNQEVTFKTSDPSIVEIEGNSLTAVGAGTVTITAQQENVDYGTLTVKINPVLPNSIVFEKDTLELGISRSTTLSAYLLPENTTDKRLIYTTSDPAVVKVDGDKITALSEGTAIITASHESGITADCTVNVAPVLLEGLDIQGVFSLVLKSTETLTAVFEPADVTDRTIQWSSSNKSIISIDNGTITANKIGKATITATHASGITASKEIEVLPIPVEKISITGDGHTLYENETLKLSVAIFPEDATDKTITWTSDNPNVATVKNGKVTAVSAGTASIIASASNGIKSTYKITVKSNTKTMKVTVSSYCSDYNHVGNEWGEYFSVNGNEIGYRDTVSVKRNGSVSVYTEIVEYDKYPDIGRGSYSVKVNSDYFENGFIITQTIYVREGNGRYSGNVAVWVVEYEFTPY